MMQKISIASSVFCILFGISEIILTYCFRNMISDCADAVSLFTWLVINGFVITFISVYDIIFRLCCLDCSYLFNAILKIMSLGNLGWLGYGAYIYFRDCDSTRTQDIVYVTLLAVFGIKLIFNVYAPRPKRIIRYADDHIQMRF